MDGFEVPFNSSDWDKLSQRMDKEKSGYSSSVGVYLGIVAGTVLLGGTLFYAFSDNNRLNDAQLADSEQVLVDEASGQETVEAGTPVLNVNETASSDAGVNEGNDVFLGESDTEVTRKEGAARSRVETSRSVDVSKSEKDTPGIVSNSSGNEAVVEDSGRREVTIIRKREKEQGRLEAISTHNGVVSAESPEKPKSDLVGGGGFMTNVSASCQATKVDFQLDKLEENVIYLWNFGDGSFSDKPEPAHVYERAGSYQVTLSMTPMNGGQIQSQKATNNIIIHSAPKAKFAFVPRHEAGKLPYVHFENISTSAKNLSWDFGDGTTSDEVHPDHVYKKAGTYQVKLGVVNANGCSDEIVQTVTVTNDNPLNAPATFSPNGDGVNDSFIPEVLKHMKGFFKFSVYETTGIMVYSSDATNSPWNGRMDNGLGQLAPAGEYVWVVDFLDGEYENQSFQGKTNLLN